MSVLNDKKSKEKIRKIRKYCDEKLKKEIDLTFVDEEEIPPDDIKLAKKHLKRDLRRRAQDLQLGKLQ